MRSKTKKDRAVEIRDLMVDERVKEMMRTYEAYGNRYGSEDITRMLEKEGSNNIEEIRNAVGSESLVGQKSSVNRNRSGEKVLQDVETEAEGIVQPSRSVVTLWQK